MSHKIQTQTVINLRLIIYFYSAIKVPTHEFNSTKNK